MLSLCTRCILFNTFLHRFHGILMSILQTLLIRFCCGFDVQLVVQQLEGPTTNPQQIENCTTNSQRRVQTSFIRLCCGLLYTQLVVELLWTFGFPVQQPVGLQQIQTKNPYIFCCFVVCHLANKVVYTISSQ